MIHKRVRDHVDLDELVALGNTGLAEAAQRFDDTRGATFATYAWYRVQGAIVDGLRKMTQLPRREWQKLVALRAAAEYLEQRAERDAGAAKAGALPALGADALAQVKQAMSAIRTMYLCSLESMQDDGEELAGPTVDPAVAIDAARDARKIRLALARLPEKERALMTKHYWEGKNIMEAGAELGISKSWASRLHAQAVDRMRAMVDDG